MLTQELYIDKKRKLEPAMDYELLRSLGLKYIEELGSKSWTDYNAHDPGITIMEQLCYALTELRYRSDFDILDLMADKDGNIAGLRSEEHTSELQSLMRISYAVFCLKKKKTQYKKQVQTKVHKTI